METWSKISLFLCVFGFLKEVRPSEPFLYEYLTGPWRNLTDRQVTTEVYPVGTYSNMLLLIIVFLITDICKYKPLIIILGLSGSVAFSIIIWTTSLFMLQVLGVFYGMFMAAEVAYYTYIYAKVDKEHYQKVTSHTRAAILAGRAISGTSSQILVSTHLLNVKQLNYITLATVIVATIWALFLPNVEHSIYFNSEDVKNEDRFSKKLFIGFQIMKRHFFDAFTNAKVIKWSSWWSLSTCGYVQVENYIQALYSSIQNSDESSYNGAVEASLTLLGFSAALVAGYVKINWKTRGEVAMALVSLCQGALILTISQTREIVLCYVFYVIFGILFHFMVTIVSAQIAKEIDEDSYGLVFGINSFLALVANSILMAVVATKGVGFALEPRGQFVVYGAYHLGVALPFVGLGVKRLF